MIKFQNKYRISTARAQWWNYSDGALYFVTICTKDKLPFLGDICYAKMNLSELGELANRFWIEIPKHFPFVKLHAHIVMPNHVHGIVETLHATSPAQMDSDEPLHARALRGENGFMASIAPKQGSLASIIRSYKSAVSKEARKIHPKFEWQARFHDHIIRDDSEYYRISNYITENPMNWDKDKSCYVS